MVAVAGFVAKKDQKYRPSCLVKPNDGTSLSFLGVVITA